MTENKVFKFLAHKNFFSRIDPIFKSNNGQHLLTGVYGSINNFIIYRDYFLNQAQTLVLLNSSDEMDSVSIDLLNFVPESEIFKFPADEILFSKNLTSSPENQMARILFLNSLIDHKKGIYLFTASSLARNIIDPHNFKEACFNLNFDSKISLEDLKNKLLSSGLKKVNKIEKIGQFAIRGDIVDFYSFGELSPVRLELFDDSIDSIRTFDLDSQKSSGQIDSVRVLPVSDRILTGDHLDVPANITDYLEEFISNGGNLDNFPYLNLFIGDYTITDYFSEKSTIFICEYAKIIDSIGDIDQRFLEFKSELDQENHYYSKLLKIPNVFSQIKGSTNRKVYLANFKRGIGRISFQTGDNIKVRTLPNFLDNLSSFESFLTDSQNQRATIIICVDDRSKYEEIKKILVDLNLPFITNNEKAIELNKINLVKNNYANGFDLVDENTQIISQTDIFGRKKQRRRLNFAIKNTHKLTNFSELKVNDYIVHINHGIGRFIGMTTETHKGVSRDYITIQFAGSGKLFLPVNQIQFIQKYQSDNGSAPKLNKLGSGEWKKTQRNVSKKIDDMSDKLIERYAERQAKKGFAFSPHSEYETEFGDAFPYVETIDQERSIKEVLTDMEKSVPMDRLIVGDVGFGKTEVAMRAAFKAVLDHKQVAILAPTTILVDQHYNNFLDRFRNFPVSIEMVSRFRTNAENKSTLESLKNGEVDIVVGTHRLLSKDVQFKDLGLLIIDEEQRFGVKHKEVLKWLKENVDVLTLTATPIPRTLQLSVLGVMDLSLIQTPPANRYPVTTYVSEFDISLIKDAISRELKRHGQVFYLHNRVSDIEHTVQFLQGMFPDAEVGFIHGQMTEVQLENTILDFLEERFDILVTTTIIEIGVDIPNVNTLIIENADHFGLSTLYQLRGRIGRSNRMAYAYLTYKQDHSITEVAEKRLSAIRDFTELGSGYRLALTDLSIRGAGNILGKEQHGFINAIGFDYFLELLSEAVKKKKGEQSKYKTKSVIELDWSNFISDDYISDKTEKIEMYQKILHAQSDEEVNDLLDELIDRFGEPPISVMNLLNTARIKILADESGILKIYQVKDQIKIIFSQLMTRHITVAITKKILENEENSIKLLIDNNCYIISLDNEKNKITSDELLSFIQKIRNVLRTIQK